ncbi:hypothetical protein RAZWK3B_01910 [Roseobacter sp. AzwK-3b]|nr:hypothetical protein RAZWK3B_01910 [Roseobacter sp. AzwK-3b]
MDISCRRLVRLVAFLNEGRGDAKTHNRAGCNVILHVWAAL